MFAFVHAPASAAVQTLAATKESKLKKKAVKKVAKNAKPAAIAKKAADFQGGVEVVETIPRQVPRSIALSIGGWH
jgi:GH18 family chitinase